MHRLIAGALGRIEDQGRPDLADRGGAVALVAGELQDRRFVEIIAGKMLVDVAEHRRFPGTASGCCRRPELRSRHRSCWRSRRCRPACGRSPCGRIRGGEGRKQRVAVAQAHALAGDRRHGGGGASSTMRKRRPSATNRTTLWGRAAGACATAAEPRDDGCETQAKVQARMPDGRKSLRSCWQYLCRRGCSCPMHPQVVEMCRQLHPRRPACKPKA
jgi:hypothetical protein